MSGRKVFGIGLPRTATKTLAQSLRVLGYCGSNVCVLTKHVQVDNIVSNQAKERTFSVNNGLFRSLAKHYARNPDSLYILTVRDQASWWESITGFDAYEDLDLPRMDVYIAYVQITIPAEQLLIINIFKEPEEQLWEKLADFIEEPTPIVHFPWPMCECNSCTKPGCDLKRQRARSNTI